MGDSAIWYYVYNKIHSTELVSGGNYRVNYSGYTTGGGVECEVNLTISFWTGTSSDVVKVDTLKMTNTAYITNHAESLESEPDLVTIYGVHKGYYPGDIVDMISYTSTDKTLEDNKESTSLKARSDSLKEEVYSKLSNQKEISDNYSFFTTLDWSRLGELAPKLVEDKRVKNAFATLLYKDLYGEVIKVGDSEPVFWFNNETEDIIVGILSKTEELILFKYL